VLADEESDVQLGISRKRPPIAKPTTPRHFSTASTHTGSRAFRRSLSCHKVFGSSTGLHELEILSNRMLRCDEHFPSSARSEGSELPEGTKVRTAPVRPWHGPSRRL